jgi:hypothetical protein
MTSRPSLKDATQTAATAASSLGIKINEYAHWRETLIATINEYIGWLDQAGPMDAAQELRLFDIKETLKNDRLLLAFLAEFSRGKTETINALFFADFNQRLLPSAPGRTTMCPTEIFANGEPAFIQLLPIETKFSNASLSDLKSQPELWQKFLLDTQSADAMKQTLSVLVEKTSVDLATAKSLGFWHEDDPAMQRQLSEKGTVEIPMWRHAMINYPHPLLQKGLVVIDTPGLNSMGAEPELTLNIIPNAHAVLFLTAIDSGITKSDMQIWSDYVKNRASHKLVLLNKIDMLWDGLESDAEVSAMVQQQIEHTAKQLDLDAKRIFAISAQKALLAKIKHDAKLLQRSGIVALEDALANQLIKSKHEILGRAIVTECANMIALSQKVADMRVKQGQLQLKELRQMQNQQADSTQEILLQVTTERKRYDASVLTFNQGGEKIKRLSDKLLLQLSTGYLNSTLEQSKQDMGDSWTTISLNRSMRTLTKQAIQLAQEIKQNGDLIKQEADHLYQLFCREHGFEKSVAMPLNMDTFINSMQSLEKITNDFCLDPINVLTEKRFLIRRFYHGLGAQIQAAFEQAQLDCSLWLNVVIGELKTQINEHKKSLDQRADALMASHNHAEITEKNLAATEKDLAKLSHQAQQLDSLLLKLMRSAKFHQEPSSSAS